MAEKPVVLPEVVVDPKAVLISEVLDRAWIRKALEFQRAGIVRSRNKEMVGSEMYVLRGKEIESLTILMQKFS